MKKFVLLLAVVGVGLLGFNYATTGELTLVPSFSKSEQEQSIADLKQHFAAAQKQFAQAHRMAATAGIDTTSEADAAVDRVRRIKRELKSVSKELSEERARDYADELMSMIQAFEATL